MSYFKPSDFLDAADAAALIPFAAVSFASRPRYGVISKAQRVVQREFEIEKADLLSRRRNREVGRPRQIAMWLASRAAGATTQAVIGRLFQRERTTITHAVEVIDGIRARDPEFRLYTDRLLAEVRR